MAGVAAPVALAVAVNALARPALAERYGGLRHQHFTTFRSSDGWWEFDAATSAAHPIITGFLGLSDGAIVAAGLLLSGSVLIAITLWGAVAATARRARARRSRAPRDPGVLSP
ncbi:hypothetical protein MUN77_16590 [Leucobacter allii]|uniref:hypothetical protein n=1 Tax=Leucobacter allii TaxID=2932247 RepID=UPI001FD53C41|nr:hypothetical protein [Leucobacter allii]UOR01704.1 hypothetical protein MUN77_16590 [Leucobacter allii]